MTRMPDRQANEHVWLMVELRLRPSSKKKSRVGQNNPFCLGLLCKVFHRKKIFFSFLPIEKKDRRIRIATNDHEAVSFIQGQGFSVSNFFTLVTYA